MAKLKKTAREKLHQDQGLPRVETVRESMSQKWGTGTFVIPSPLEVDGIMKTVPVGKVITINGIRDILAKRHQTNFACPITTGIFAGIAAKAAAEDEAEGKTDITPWWRTLKGKGELNEKYPGGREEQAERLMAEGHEIEEDRQGNPKRVKDWEQKLVEV